ncbi:unnamed protein product [Absidia cylindrospora]
MQSTRRLNKRQPVSVTALPIKVETTASPGNMTPALSDTSFQQPQYQTPAHLEQPSTHQVHAQHSEPLIQTAYEPVVDNHDHTRYQQHSHTGYDNSCPSHDHDNDHIHNHYHHDHHKQQQHVEYSHKHDSGYGHQHSQTNDHHQSHIGHGHNHAHHGHVHIHQGHDHDHPHHSHNSHGHDHAHEHEGHHHHHHSYPPVFTPPLPSWSELFSTLSPTQKTVFTWFIIHSAIGIWVYCIGISNGTLAVVGFSYLVIFDALGVLNSFISSIIRTSSSYGYSNTKRPFGAHRYEIIFAMATTIYLLFATMHNTKESLEHFLLEGHHGGEHHEESSFGFGTFLAVSVAIGTCCLASVALRNHDNFVRFLRRTPPTVHGFSYNVVNRGRGNPINVILSNVYSFSIVSCGLLVLISNMFGLSSSSIDKLLALVESVVMFYLGYPTAKALANLLLQTTPNTVRNGVETRLYEIKQNPNIISVDRVHFWQNTYGRCIGTLEVQTRADADEQVVLQFIYQKLEGLTSSGGDGYDDVGQPSELTVSIIKN